MHVKQDQFKAPLFDGGLLGRSERGQMSYRIPLIHHFSLTLTIAHQRDAIREARIQAQLAHPAKTDPHAKSAHPSDFFDASIIDELHKEGFVKALWASE